MVMYRVKKKVKKKRDADEKTRRVYALTRLSGKATDGGETDTDADTETADTETAESFSTDPYRPPAPRSARSGARR